MKRVGKIFLGVLCAAAVAAGGFWINDRLSYPIDPGLEGLEAAVETWMNRGTDAPYDHQLRLYEPVALEDRIYVPMEVGEGLGCALLERSFTGRYRIAGTSYGSGSFRNGVIQVGEDRYLLFQGRNQSGVISRARFQWDGAYEYEGAVPHQWYCYETAVPQERVFFLSIPVDGNVPLGPILPEDISLFDAWGEDITGAVDLSGGSIR